MWVPQCSWGVLWWNTTLTSFFSSFKGQPFYSKGQYILLPAPLDTINVHVRDGHIIPQQVWISILTYKALICRLWVVDESSLHVDNAAKPLLISNPLYNFSVIVHIACSAKQLLGISCYVTKNKQITFKEWRIYHTEWSLKSWDLAETLASCFLWSSFCWEGACFDNNSLTQKPFLPDGGSDSRWLGLGWLVLGWWGQPRHFWKAKLLLRYLHSRTGAGGVLHFTVLQMKSDDLQWYLAIIFCPGICRQIKLPKCFYPLPQSQIVSKPLHLNGALDGLVLEEVLVFGVPSPPRCVLANGERVADFTYRTDIKVSFVFFYFPHHVSALLHQANLSVFLSLKVLTVAELALPMSEAFTIQWVLWRASCTVRTSCLFSAVMWFLKTKWISLCSFRIFFVYIFENDTYLYK